MSAHDKGKIASPVVSRGWFRSFLQRQPHLSYCRGDSTAKVRMKCLSKEVMADYFELIREELTGNELMNKPSRIYNVDETGMCLDGSAPRVIALKSQKRKVWYRTSGNKSGYSNNLCECYRAVHATFCYI